MLTTNFSAVDGEQVTQLPASLGIAASFDTSLAYRYGQVLGQEAWDKGTDVVQGPELNLDRVPQSGRLLEAYGEDPYFTTAMSVANIEGIQCETSWRMPSTTVPTTRKRPATS